MSSSFPWLKLQKSTKRSPKIREMSLEQQAIFYNLLQHAGLQDPEGSFDVSDREMLAFEVAKGREDLLDEVLTYLVKMKILAWADTTTMAFINYEEHQGRVYAFMRQSWNAMRRSVAPKALAVSGNYCVYCGREDQLTIDHIIPLASGGGNDFENLQVLCKPCNSRKGTRVDGLD